MLLLASSSPRRAELLAAAGIPFEIFAVPVDESLLDGETPEAHVRRLAEAKARAAAATHPARIVLGADTVVVIDGQVLGKPRDAAHAAAMLQQLSGRDHEVLTGVAIVAPAGEFSAGVACTRVWFATLTNEDIERYVASGEPMDKAGAYAIQGLGSRFVERIDGSYSNVVGLPVSLVWRLLGDVPGTRRGQVT